MAIWQATSGPVSYIWSLDPEPPNLLLINRTALSGVSSGSVPLPTSQDDIEIEVTRPRRLFRACRLGFLVPSAGSSSYSTIITEAKSGQSFQDLSVGLRTVSCPSPRFHRRQRDRLSMGSGCIGACNRKIEGRY